MRVINYKCETITEYDLSAGRLIPATVIRADATPIDNITKFAWTEEDYEEVWLYVVITAEEKIAKLKAQLSATDYKIIKCSECQLLGIELPYDIAELHAERQKIRDEINELEKI